MRNILVAVLAVAMAVASTPVAAQKKVLVLHGGGGSATSAKYIFSDISTALGSDFSFVYAERNASRIVTAGEKGGENWWADPPSKDEPTTDPKHADAMITALDAIVAAEGPFWGIIGYSQGAAAVPVYLSNVTKGTFQAAAMFCGYLPNTHKGLLSRIDAQAPFGDIPALVWLSTTDWWFAWGSPDLSKKFTNPTYIESNPGPGHMPPLKTDPTFNCVLDWFRDPTAVSTCESSQSSSSASSISGSSGAVAASGSGAAEAFSGLIATVVATALICILL